MKKISNKQYRKIMKWVLDEINGVFQDELDKKIHLRDVDAVFASIGGLVKESRKGAGHLLVDEFSICNVGISCVGLLSLSIDPSDSDGQLFPPDWNSPSSVNPNFVVSRMLANITNTAMGVRLLIENGLDSQARSLLRIFMELTWICLVLIFDKKIFSDYVGTNDDESSKFWAKYFRSYALNETLNKIEASFGMDDELLKELRMTRKESYAFYSNVVHHSYNSMMLGAMVFNPSDMDELGFGVFGAANRASRATIDYLNYVIWYFVLSFFAITDKVHGLKPTEPKENFWCEAFALSQCLNKLFLHYKASIEVDS